MILLHSKEERLGGGGSSGIHVELYENQHPRIEELILRKRKRTKIKNVMS